MLSEDSKLLAPESLGKSNLQRRQLTQRRFGIRWNVDTRIEQSMQQRAASAVNDFRIRDSQLHSTDAADFSVLDQHAAVFEYAFAVKQANVANHQCAGR